MTRYINATRTAILAGLVSAAALALLAAPAEATLVCPPGTTDSSYCTNVPPTAATGPATGVGPTSATLNGVSGPGVVDGDITNYYFQYGTTTAYGSQTPTGTVGTCPSGVTSGPSCSVPVTQSVSATITGLATGRRYHYQIVSTSPDGTSFGVDHTFKTQTVHPIASVTAPARVQHGHFFIVVVSLNLGSTVVITLLHKGSVIKTFNEGFRTGTFHQRIKAPDTQGLYALRVKATAPGVTPQTVNRSLTVF